MKDKIVALLKPQASTDVKLSVISLFIAKMMEMYERRIDSLEERQLQKGDKGDRGEDGEVDYKRVNKYLDSAIDEKISLEMVDIGKVMEHTWDKW